MMRGDDDQIGLVCFGPIQNGASGMAFDHQPGRIGQCGSQIAQLLVDAQPGFVEQFSRHIAQRIGRDSFDNMQKGDLGPVQSERFGQLQRAVYLPFGVKGDGHQNVGIHGKGSSQIGAILHHGLPCHLDSGQALSKVVTTSTITGSNERHSSLIWRLRWRISSLRSMA